MDFYQFNFLPMEQRAELVWTRGQYLDFREEKGCCVVLYYLNEYFAEVWFSPKDNEIALAHGFKNLELLEPYLKTFHIRDLM